MKLRRKRVVFAALVAGLIALAVWWGFREFLWRRQEPSPSKQVTAPAEIDPAWHASRMKAGEFTEPENVSQTKVLDDAAMKAHMKELTKEIMHILITGEPYHVRKLIQAGHKSGPVLLDMLEDDTLTPFEYLGSSLTFSGGLTLETELRQATLGDIADYCLERIYKVEVGYRSYHDESTRKEAIARWKQVVEDSDKRFPAEALRKIQAAPATRKGARHAEAKGEGG